MFKPSAAYKLDSRAKGNYQIRFKAVGDAERIAKGGPNWFDQNLLVMKRWDSCLVVERDHISSFTTMDSA